MQNATKYHRDVQKYSFHLPQNTNSLRDMGNNTTHMVFEGELAVKLHVKDVEVGTSSDRNPRQGQVTMYDVWVEVLVIVFTDFLQWIIPYYVFIALNSFNLSLSLDVFWICFSIVVPWYSSLANKFVDLRFVLMDCLTSLLIHDGLLIVLRIFGTCLLLASLILFLKISNPWAVSVLIIISCSKV